MDGVAIRMIRSARMPGWPFLYFEISCFGLKDLFRQLVLFDIRGE